MTTLLLLLLPSLLFLAGVFALPLVRYLWLSFHADSVMTGLVAIPNDGANWQRFFHDLRYWQDLGQTLRFAVASVTLELLLGLAIALMLNQPQRGRSLDPNHITDSLGAPHNSDGVGLALDLQHALWPSESNV